MWDRTQPVLDSDGHVAEEEREIFEYLPPPYAGARALFSFPFFPTLDGFHRTARVVADGKGGLRALNPNGQDWLEYIEEVNIAATVLFPTAGLGFGLIVDPDWAAGLARAYNDWLYDRYLRLNPKRLKGVALIPLQDPPRAAAELRRAVEDQGMVGAVFPSVGLQEAFGHTMYWPVYETAQELNVPVLVHGAPSYGIGVDRLRKMIEMRALNHTMPQLVQMTSMMFGGVFDLFPRLRVAYLEAGCGWVPYLMDRLDRAYHKRGKVQAPELKVPPSEHLKSGRVFIHSELDEQGLAYCIQVLGEDAFVCASDFPHEPRHEFPEGLDELEKRQDLSDSAKRKLTWDNTVRMYALNEAEVIAATPSASGVA